MKKPIIIILSFLCGISALWAQLSVQGSRTVVLTPEASTGLAAVYVIENPAQASLVYQSASESVQWQKFGNAGGGYAEDIEASRSADTYSVAVGSADAGYIITDGSKRTCVWLCSYAAAPFGIQAVAVGETDCDRTWLSLSGSAPEMVYYTVNGQRKLVDRGISVSYNSMKYNRDEKEFVNDSQTRWFEYAGNKIWVPAPLCDTEFTLHPDRFATAWQLADDMVSPMFRATAVKAETSAVQSKRDADNEVKIETESLGGSAPCEVTFTASVTEAAIFHRWEISETSDFSNSYLTFDDLEFTHTFNDAGNTYVRFTANNADGSCPVVSDPYVISIGESMLQCPNAFSPNGDGVNDQWKVSYKSIVDFHCDIFNRWGKKLTSLTEPWQGWDGMINGKPVQSGVYFYVLKARGADGRKYSLSGDINVVGYNPRSNNGAAQQ